MNESRFPPVMALKVNLSDQSPRGYFSLRLCLDIEMKGLSLNSFRILGKWESQKMEIFQKFGPYY